MKVHWNSNPTFKHKLISALKHCSVPAAPTPFLHLHTKLQLKSLLVLHKYVQAFPHIWQPLVLIPTLVILSSVRSASASRAVECKVFHRGHFGDAWLWTIITIFETTNNLSASWPLCVSKRRHFTSRQEPPTRSMHSPTWILYFCLTKTRFVFPRAHPPERWTRTERWRQAASNEIRVQTDLPANLPWDFKRCSVPCHNLLRSLNKTGLSWFP